MVMGKRSDGEEGVGVLTPRRKTGGSASDLCQARLFRGGSGILVGQSLEELGQVAERDGSRLRIDATDVLRDIHLGDSIAVNGCCLTVTRFDANEGWFEVGLANETLARTNLGPSRLTFGTPRSFPA